jgi:hypothetical protein
MITATLAQPIILYRDGNEWCVSGSPVVDRSGNSRFVIRCDYDPLKALNKYLQAVEEYQGNDN